MCVYVHACKCAFFTKSKLSDETVDLRIIVQFSTKSTNVLFYLSLSLIGASLIFQVLWPNGTFFTRLEGFQSRTEENQPNSGPVQSTNRMYGDKASRPSSFEQQLEASRRASDVKNLLLCKTTCFSCFSVFYLVNFTSVIHLHGSTSV